MSTQPPRSLGENLRSLRNAVSLHIAGALRFSRGVHCERPCRQLRKVSTEHAERIALLSSRYAVRFEDTLNEETSLNNYAYLELLDRAWQHAGASRPAGLSQSDIGCGNFWYVAALQAFFRPQRLTGFEIDSFRRYANAHTRQDFALGYTRNLPETRFQARDYLAVQEKVELISCWFPFLTPHAILAWGLPLKLLNPEKLFIRIAANLSSDGVFLMVNHGGEEAKYARVLCEAAGLRLEWQWSELDPLRPRPQPAVISYWQR